MAQRPGHVERLAFELINQSVELSAFFARKRAVIALGKQCRQAFALASRHTECATYARCYDARLFSNRKAVDGFQQLPTLRFWQLEEGIA